MSLSMPGHLYFTRGALLYMSNPDGSGARQLTTYGTMVNPDIMPAVSRDGTHLVYVHPLGICFCACVFYRSSGKDSEWYTRTEAPLVSS
ncbi:MAG: hypothetical protein NVSMB65_10250 [Chloroflexota bacterium]